MKFALVFLVLAVAAFSCVSASSSSSLVEVDACTYGGQMGQCIPDSSPCTGPRYSGLCTGASNIRCCMPSAQALFGDNGNGARITQTALQRLSETQHQEKWARWKSIHKPTFTSPAQEQAVYAVFRDNRIQTVYMNDRYGNGKTVWSSITKFSAHRPDIFAQQRLTFRNPTPSKGRSLLEMNNNENFNSNSMMTGDDSIQWKTFQKMAAALRANEKEAGITSFLENEASSTVEARGGYEDWLKAHEEEHAQFEKKKFTDGPVSPDKPVVAAVAKLQLGKGLIVDYRNLIGPIRNQQTCGSCWAHASTAVLEGAMSRAGIPMKTLSPQWLVDCLADAPNQRCKGGFADYSFSKLQNMQIATEAEVPYKSAELACTLPRGGTSGILVSESGIVSHCLPPLLPSGLDYDYPNANCNSFTDAGLLDLLKKYGPVSIHIAANSWMNYVGGLMTSDSCKHGFMDINHAVVLVGYGQQEDGKFYWLIRNHWGNDWWGEEGYARVEVGGYACGAANYVTFANVKKA